MNPVEEPMHRPSHQYPSLGWRPGGTLRPKSTLVPNAAGPPQREWIHMAANVTGLARRLGRVRE
ncbi:hypothetical protein SEA_DELIAN_34 [Gordonia phage Delian]|uniref:hypothetical protein n=1 Tax=Gordonia phage CaptainKirk2 TaxID=1887643 RepID=UPI00084F6BEC|nr:hypothetical protein BIZ76_gp33 [Gordonia phage CaptainKirk2]AOE43976.1 hypothetical protein SEA_CAPTAINKIRK2_33 [Gordonia phage CaptainKirk2]QGH77954.1 hypothetical protein SEA_DELIAN_34 [Gordonia phage Delian]